MANQKLSEKQLRTLLGVRYDDRQKAFPNHTTRFLAAEYTRAKELFPPDKRLEIDVAALRERAKLREAEALYKGAMFENEKLRSQLAELDNFPDVAPRDLRITGKSGEREATAVALFSDIHCEERVAAEQVNGLNEYSLAVFDKRSKRYFANVCKLVEKESQDIAIKNLVLWVGGDLTSGSIHPDLAESNQLGPTDAIALIQDTLAGGIQQLLKDLPGVAITVLFSSGNHARFTKEQRWQTEHANSLEWLLAHSLARAFKDTPRVRMVRDRALLSYLEVHGRTIRFTHGHAVSYGGGVGGITIPIAKAIAGWDRGRQAYLTVMGHFHQLTFGPNFVVNGSMIGTSPYSMAIKAAHEPPAQAFFLIDAKHGLTVRAPVLLEG